MTDPTTLLRAMIEGDAEVRAMVAEVLGVQPWPYDNLVLRTPHCPRCGARAQMLVGEYIEPIAMCPEHDCAIFNWDPTKPAELLLATSKVMIKRALPDGGTVMEPHEPDCALAVPHPDDVTPTCTCSERQETT